MDCVLSINAGSASVKLALCDCSKLERAVASAKIDILSSKKSFVKYLANGDREVIDLDINKENIAIIEEWLRAYDVNIIAISHRVVHGGLKYGRQAIPLTGEVIAEIKKLAVLAPLHQYFALEYIENIGRILPKAQQFACFDTAFHRDIQKTHRHFAIPRKFTDDGVIRYGFHGIAYEHVLKQLQRILPEKANGRVIAIHLGNGCSACAMIDGKSYDTSMGFTAIDGLMMGTRCGSLDPGIIFFMMDNYKMSIKDVERVLYKESGLKGVSGISNDVRELVEANNEHANEAINLFSYIALKEVFGLIGVLGGVDVIVFSGGIGENAGIVRSNICSKMAWLGLDLDQNANNQNKQFISSASSKIAVCTVHVDEEQMMAYHVVNFFNGEKNAEFKG
ncbi:Acetate kinase [Alphaproteobacteria bacterium]